MKRIVWMAGLLLGLLAGVSAQGKEPRGGKTLTEKDMGAYLFTFFNDLTHSLFMAVSYDGYSFTAVNGGRPVMGGDSIAAQRGVRDPHVCRAPNGMFYIAMTDLHVFGKQRGLRETLWERDERYGWLCGNVRLQVFHTPWPTERGGDEGYQLLLSQARLRDTNHKEGGTAAGKVLEEEWRKIKVNC